MDGVSGAREQLAERPGIQVHIARGLDRSMQRIGPYEITGQLGEGAMGMVWRGFDPKVNRPVAIKMIRQELFQGLSAAEQQTLRDRFLREAQAAGALSHPGIVIVYLVGEQDG